MKVEESLFPHAITQLAEIQKNLSEAKDGGKTVELSKGNAKRVGYAFQDIQKIINLLKITH